MSDPNKKPDPTGWRVFIENVIKGDNYFRTREYYKLLDDFERTALLVETLEAQLADRQSAPPPARIDISTDNLILEWGYSEGGICVFSSQKVREIVEASMQTPAPQGEVPADEELSRWTVGRANDRFCILNHRGLVVLYHDDTEVLFAALKIIKEQCLRGFSQTLRSEGIECVTEAIQQMEEEGWHTSGVLLDCEAFLKRLKDSAANPQGEMPELPKATRSYSVQTCCGQLTPGGDYMGATEMTCCGNPEVEQGDAYTADEMHAYAAQCVAAAPQGAHQVSTTRAITQALNLLREFEFKGPGDECPECEGHLGPRNHVPGCKWLSTIKALDEAAWQLPWDSSMVDRRTPPVSTGADAVAWAIYSHQGRLCELRYVKPTQENLDWWQDNSSDKKPYTYGPLYATPQGARHEGGEGEAVTDFLSNLSVYPVGVNAEINITLQDVPGFFSNVSEAWREYQKWLYRPVADSPLDCNRCEKAPNGELTALCPRHKKGAAPTPPGYVLVPLEATLEMIAAPGMATAMRSGSAAQIYRAMIAAAKKEST